MDTHLMEENLREAASTGNLDALKDLLKTGVNVNSRNKINGWTALHWASKRGHKAVISLLLSEGADQSILNAKNEMAAELSEDEGIHQVLQAQNVVPKVSQVPITPNYLRHPEWPYNKSANGASDGQADVRYTPVVPSYNYAQYSNELVLKVRIADGGESDFYEVELDRTSLTYDALLGLMTTELGVDRDHVRKIRKLPDTVVRKDKDVKRLVDLQELELVLGNKYVCPSPYVQSHSMNRLKTNNKQILY